MQQAGSRILLGFPIYLNKQNRILHDPKPNNFVPEHSVDFISILILMKKVVQKYCLKFIMKSNHLTKNTLYFDPH